MQSIISTFNFTSNMSRSNWTWQTVGNHLTINFKYKYFHNFTDWSGIYLLSWLAKILRFKVFGLLENTFVKLPHSWHDGKINRPSRTATPLSPTDMPMKNCPRKKILPSLHEKLLKSVRGYFMGNRLYAFFPLENYAESMCSLNICKEVRTKNF